MDLLVDRVAGLDVAKDEVVVAVRVPEGAKGDARRSGRSGHSLRASRRWRTG